MSETETTTAKPDSFRHGLSYHTSKAIDFLKAGKHGDTATREEMAKIIDRPCGLRDKGYGNVNSAIRVVERENRIIWRWSTELQKWKCLGDAERVVESRRQITLARKRAKRSLRVSAAVRVSELKDEERIAHNVNVALAGAVVMFGGSAARKRLAEAESIKEPRIGDIDKLFLGNGDAK